MKIVDLFTEQVAIRGDALAVADEARRLSYLELDRASDTVAEGLRERVGARREAVGVLVGAGAAAMTAVLGVLKSGNVAVPLDPAAPADRVTRCLEHVDAALVLTERDPDGGPLRARRAPVGTDDDQALVYFTSGSTGEPKGVAFDHRAVAGGARSAAEALGLEPDDRVGVVFPTHFGASRGPLFGALVRGASAHLFDPAGPDPHRLIEWVAAEALSVAYMSTAMLRVLLSALSGRSELPALRLVAATAAAMRAQDVERFHERLAPPAALAAVYGATETGPITMMPFHRGRPLDDTLLPVGHPVPGVEVVLEDADDDGVGRVLVRSPFVANSYWGNPRTTAATFPVDAGLGERRTFRSSDRGAFLSDGSLVLRGREDDVVKIRGFAVSLGGVEKALLDRAPVADVAVVAWGEDPSLVAYVVPTPGSSPPTTSALRGAVVGILPSHMIPAAFVTLTTLPRTSRGKVDRARLPAPSSVRPELDTPFVQPRYEFEAGLASIWTTVLGVSPIGRHDIFVELGGDSIAAVEVASMIDSVLGLRVPDTILARASTIAQLAEALAHRDEAARRSAVVPIRAGGTRLPLFYIPGSGGTSLSAMALSRRLDPDQPVYGIEAHGLHRRGRPDTTVEKSARRAVREMRQVQPRGPYRLAGYSGGASIAYETAQQLVGDGCAVTSLVLIDPIEPAPAPPPSWRQRFLWFGPGPGTARYGAFFVLGRAMTSRYRPKPYAGSTVIVRSEHERGAPCTWKDALTGHGVVVFARGDHHSMLWEPNVGELATAVEVALTFG